MPGVTTFLALSLVRVTPVSQEMVKHAKVRRDKMITLHSVLEFRELYEIMFVQLIETNSY